MSANRYEFLPRADDEQGVIRELEEQDLDFQQKFYDFVVMTNAHGWDQREHLETLDQRYQTYVLMIGGDRHRRAMLTRTVGTDRYHYLGLTWKRDDRDAAQEAYLAACKAHELVDPVRVTNPHRP